MERGREREREGERGGEREGERFRSEEMSQQPRGRGNKLSEVKRENLIKRCGQTTG